MISRSKLKNALREALDKADPNQAHYPEIKRERITYPMKEFTHALRDTVTEYPQITAVSFEFGEEEISGGLTTCILRTESRTMRLTYDYHDGTVKCSCVGRDIDRVEKTVSVSDLVAELREFFPKRRVVIVRRKTS